jgi:short-subunit dehydrogenase
MNTTHTVDTALDRAPLPRCIVTGASSGLGLALATQPAASGVPVIAIARSSERLHALSRQLPLVAAARSG